MYKIMTLQDSIDNGEEFLNITEEIPVGYTKTDVSLSFDIKSPKKLFLYLSIKDNKPKVYYYSSKEGIIPCINKDLVPRTYTFTIYENNGNKIAVLK